MIFMIIIAIIVAVTLVNERTTHRSRLARSPVVVSVEPARSGTTTYNAQANAQAAVIESNVRTITGSHAPLSAERLAKGDMDRNIIALNRKINQQPDNAELWLHRASAYMLNGNIEMAVRNMEIASALQPAYLPLTQKVKETQNKLTSIGRKRLTREEMAIAIKNVPPERIAKVARVLMEGHQQSK